MKVYESEHIQNLMW